MTKSQEGLATISDDYKWYEYCPNCKIPKFIGELPDREHWIRCEVCGAFLRYCSKDVLVELE